MAGCDVQFPHPQTRAMRSRLCANEHERKRNCLRSAKEAALADTLWDEHHFQEVASVLTPSHVCRKARWESSVDRQPRGEMAGAMSTNGVRQMAIGEPASVAFVHHSLRLLWNRLAPTKGRRSGTGTTGAESMTPAMHHVVLLWDAFHEGRRRHGQRARDRS
jgi:hypothetical protein